MSPDEYLSDDAPAMSVPLHWTAQGLPLGVQFVAPHGGEGLLFGLAGPLERAQPRFDRRAPAFVRSPVAVLERLLEELG